VSGQLETPILASFPSPTQSVWHLGPLPIRAYALCIVLGIVVAIAMTSRRWRDRGGNGDQLGDIAAWGVIFGILGGRIYSVITTPDPYFGKNGHPIDALKIYQGGLGIWGAILLGGVGVIIGCHRKGVKFRVFADAAAPGIIAAQAIGRWGNWFNNELYGRATTLPWKLEIHDVSVDTGKAAVDANGHVIVLGYFQPTFLYESLWCAFVCIALLAIDRRFALGRGRLFCLYVVMYSFGRFWIESLRIDMAHHFLGLRLNEWTALVVIVGGVAWFVTHPGPREDSVYIRKEDAESADVPDTDAEARAAAGISVAAKGDDSHNE
jgi:prolipoprotein diacylglyceryl transferase